MKPHAHGRRCKECGDHSRVGKRVGSYGLCRWCYEALPEEEKAVLREQWRETARRRAEWLERRAG